MKDGSVKYRVPFIKPHFPDPNVITQEYGEIVESNWFTNFGPKEKEFCQKVEGYIGGNVSVATAANGTLALDLCVRALFEKGSDKREVIIPSFTFAAGPEVLIANSFKPVFIDIEENTLQPSIEEAKKYIKHSGHLVAGIVLCNSFGVGNLNIKKWEELAATENIPIIVDSAAGLGSKYAEGERVGTRGDCEIFSMHATKPFSVGEGGLVVSRSKQIITDIKSIQNFGFNAQKEIGFVGMNAKLQEINCAIGLRQLEDFEERINSRHASLRIYKKELEGVGCTFQANDSLSSVPFVTTLAESKEKAASAHISLMQAGVEARKYYQPLHRSSLLSRYSTMSGSMRITEETYSRVISLPVHDNMRKELVEEITMIVTKGLDCA